MKQKEKFLSQETVAEINNALAIILGYAQLLKKKPEMTPDDERSLQKISNKLLE